MGAEDQGGSQGKPSEAGDAEPQKDRESAEVRRECGQSVAGVKDPAHRHPLKFLVSTRVAQCSGDFLPGLTHALTEL